MRIGITDHIHINDETFPSFFRYLSSQTHSITQLLPQRGEECELISRFGNYSEPSLQPEGKMAASILQMARHFEEFDCERLYKAEIGGLQLWPLCRSETLCFLLSRNSWQFDVLPKDDQPIFERAFRDCKSDLVLNMAMARFWIEYWHARRSEIFQLDIVCVNAGSMIYTRALAETLRSSKTKCFVLGETLVRDRFFFEERYNPLPNDPGVSWPNTRRRNRNSGAKNSAVDQGRAVSSHAELLAAADIKKAPAGSRSIPKFSNSEKNVLIAGDALNDFDLIEHGFPYVGTIPVYKALIKRLLSETSFNIVFSAPTSEQTLPHLTGSPTFDALVGFVSEQSDADRARILVVKNGNISQLSESCDFFVTCTSQSGLEAALTGLRPFVLGTSIYSRAGFTVNASSIETLVDALVSQSGVMTLEEYKSFKEFTVDMMRYGTASDTEDYERAIAKVMEATQMSAPHRVKRTEITEKPETRISTKSGGHWTPIYVFKEVLPAMDFDDMKRVFSGLIDFSILDLPTEIELRDGTLQMRVAVYNQSDFILPQIVSKRRFRLSYHLFDQVGRRYEWNGAQTPILEQIGDEAVLSLPLNIPKHPGTYDIQPGIVLPGKFWLDATSKWRVSVG